MVQAKPKKLTFEEYLADENRGGDRCELIDGELIPLPPESELNDSTANYLFLAFVSAGIPFRLVRPHTCEVQVPVLQAGDAANRFPDVVVLREEHLPLTQRRLTITQDMPPPRLVVEVVSPGRTNQENDYVRKRAQYARRGIPEYWIVNPKESNVTILQLEDAESVEMGVFSGTQPLVSPMFPNLVLTAAQLFQAAGKG